MEQMTTFQIGKTYTTKSICDSNCIFSFEVLKRTEKTITIKDIFGEIVKRGVYLYEGNEQCKPLGNYSMCPIISA
jgi:hypothetical protein